MIRARAESPATALLPCGRPRPIHDEPVSDPDAWRERLEEYLARSGLRRSDQRFQIAERILETGGHQSAQEIIERVREKHPEIGAATVYRTLKVLCEAGVLTETLVDDEGRAVYEITADAHHDHIVCLDCNEIFEFHEPKIEAVQTDLCAASGFRLSGHRHVLFAHCQRLADLKRS